MKHLRKHARAICAALCGVICVILYFYYENGNRSVIIAPSSVEIGGGAVQEAVVAESVIRVYVSGEVADPGVYELPTDARVEDAIAAAGGFTENADRININLAAYLRDAQQIIVYRQEDASVPVYEDASTPLININTADKGKLMELSGIGDSLAQAIIDYRNDHGDFASIEELKNVSGIGDKSFEKLKDYITAE